MVEVALPVLPPAAHTPAYGEVDLTTCDREPIHIPGAVQPHGVLLALDASLTEVVMASRNTGPMLGRDPADVVGSPAAGLLGLDLLDRVAAADPDDTAMLEARLAPEPAGRLRDGPVDVRVHRSGSRVVLEIEDRDVARSGAPELTVRSSQQALARLAQATSVTGLAERLVLELRSLLGFDRVMVYRFDREWNGEVIAEARRPDLNPFLGLHYPATDIPAQARRLYTVNWTRLIVDIAYEPVPLLPVLDPATQAPLDLSHSALRSVSPIHVEYLGHMGVTASMSISLLVNGALWGLVACHHYSGPHRPHQDARSGAAVLGQVASQLFADREQAERRNAAQATHTRLTGILDRVTRAVTARRSDPLEALLAEPGLPELLQSQGVAVFSDGVVRTVGTTPPTAELRRVAAALDHPGRPVSATDSLGDAGLLRPPGPGPQSAGDQVAGALRVGLDRDRWVMWLRPEQEHFVDWGGDPTNKLLAAREGAHVRLSPRRSFEKWRQVVRGTSQPWTDWQTEAAETLGNALTSLLLLHSRDQIVMAESMQRSVVLDRAPDLPGLHTSARYLPASTLQLGGDWWDAFELPDGRLALVVGDVAGHGVHAASAMVQIRTALRAYLVEGHPPAVCLDKLDLLMAQLFRDQVASAVVAITDLRTADGGSGAVTVELAGAGHPPAVVIRPGPDGPRADLVWRGHRPLLGLGLPSGTSTTLTLDRGDTVLLYTDGLVERRGADLGEALERLRVTCEQVAPVAATPLDHWTELVLQAEEASPEDDTTLLAFRPR